MLYSNLDSTLLEFLAQPSSKNDEGCVILRVGRHQRLGKIIVVVALSSMQSMLDDDDQREHPLFV